MFKLTNRELKEHMEACSSIKKTVRHQHGETIIWKPRVGLLDNGNLMPLEMFLRLTGERKFILPTAVEPKTDRERAILKACKSDYKNAMKGLFGPKWKTISNALNIFNVPEDKALIEEIKSLIHTYYE